MELGAEGHDLPVGLVGGDRFRLLRGELGAEGHDLLVGRFRGFGGGGIRFRFFGDELGAEVLDLLEAWFPQWLYISES